MKSLEAERKKDTNIITAISSKAPSSSFGKISPEELKTFEVLSDENKKKYLEEIYMNQGKPIPYAFRKEAKSLGVLKSAAQQYGAVKSPAQTTANIKAISETMKVPTAEIAKSDEVSKQEVAKKLAQLQSTIKPASQKGALVGAGGSQSVPRASGNLGTSISGPIDDLLENLFNHTLLNDLNKIYPTSYAV